MFETEDPHTSTHCTRADEDRPPSSRRSRGAYTPFEWLWLRHGLLEVGGLPHEARPQEPSGAVQMLFGRTLDIPRMEVRMEPNQNLGRPRPFRPRIHPLPIALGDGRDRRGTLRFGPGHPCRISGIKALASLHRGSPRPSPATAGEATVGDTELLPHPHARPGCAEAGKARLSRLGMVAWRS